MSRDLPTPLAAALWAIAAAGLAMALRDIWAFRERLSILPSLQVDAATYDALGAALAAGGSLADIPIRQPPGFVLLLAAIYAAVGHSWAAAKTVIWGCHAAAVIIAAAVSRRVWAPSAAPLAAALVATAPALRHYSGTLQYEVVVGAWWLGLVWWVSAAAATADPVRRRLGLAGAAIAGGALILTREVFMGVVPLLATWAALSGPRRRWRARAAEGVVFLVLAASLPIAWSAYQTSRAGQLVVISDKGPVTFALGNNPLATGTYDMEVLGEPAGAAFVRARPLDAARLVVRKSGYFWGVLRDVWNVPRPAALWLHRASLGLVPIDTLSMLARGGWLLVGFVAATLVLYRRGLAAEWWILPGSVAALWAAHAVTLASHRFAVPILPVVFVLIAGPATAILASAARWVGAQRGRRAALLTALGFSVVAQLGPWPAAVTFRAADMDAINADDVVDDVTGAFTRFVGAARGPRPAAVLADHYLPSGDFQMVVTLRRRGAPVAADVPVLRATLTTLDGGTACAEDIPAGLAPTQEMGRAWIPCHVPREGPVTIALEAHGIDDLWIEDVTLVRRPASAR